MMIDYDAMVLLTAAAMSNGQTPEDAVSLAEEAVKWIHRSLNAAREANSKPLPTSIPTLRPR